MDAYDLLVQHLGNAPPGTVRSAPVEDEAQRIHALPRTAGCPSCDGRGAKLVDRELRPCATCTGTGAVPAVTACPAAPTKSRRAPAAPDSSERFACN